jgi:formyltetrahydrofolate-dependent phosphoribosylglycinamide formyltransferase
MDVGKLVLYTDGGSRGNPGPGAAAYVLKDSSGKTFSGKAFFIPQTTNNVAEYTAVVRGLEAAQKAGATQIELMCDSELTVRQIHGHYKVKSDNLRDLFMQVMELLMSFQSWKAVHIPREKNKEADKLANQAMDAGRDVEWEKATPAKKVRPVRLGLLISGGGRTMVNINQAINAGTLPAQIAAVICSRREIKGVELARQIGFEPAIIRVKDYPDVEQFSQKITETLDVAKVELVIQAGWLCMWHIPKQYENRVMNIHPALLPSFGGQGMWGHHVHEAVLRAGCKVSGCTVHFCTNEYDKGPIIVQRTCPVMSDDTPDTLAARVFEQECLAYPEAIRLFAENRLAIKDGVVKVRQSAVSPKKEENT